MAGSNTAAASDTASGNGKKASDARHASLALSCPFDSYPYGIHPVGLAAAYAYCLQTRASTIAFDLTCLQTVMANWRF